MRRAVLLLVVAVIGAGGACNRDGLQEGDTRLEVGSDAEVMAARPGASLRRVTGQRTLPAGSTVAVRSGTARLELDGGQRLEVRRGSELRLGRRPTLVDGDLLVASTGRRLLTVSAGGSVVRVDGAARLSRDLAVSAASYRGSLEVRSAGRSLRVRALRQADVPSLGVVPAEPQPLDYDAADAWDRRFLGDAIEVGEELEAKSEGFTSSLRAGEGRTPGFFRLLLPALEEEPSFGAPLISDRRSPGETLVGATIAVTAEQGSFLSRWRTIFAFRDQGAAWGLVALDQRVREASGLVQSVDAAIGRAALAFAPTGAPSPPTSGQPAVGSPPATSATGGGPGPGTGAGGSAGSGGSPPRPSSGAPATPPTLPPPPSAPSPTVPPPGEPVTPSPEPPPSTAPLQPLVDTIAGLLR